MSRRTLPRDGAMPASVNKHRAALYTRVSTDERLDQAYNSLDDASILRRVSAAEIETAVVDQVRALLRQPEIVIGTWLAARREAPDLTEREVRDALHRLDPLWSELFPAEQARIVRTLVDRVVVGPASADILLRVEGLAGLVRDLGEMRAAA